MNRDEITKRIKEKFGTVKHFCKVNNINYNTFNVVMCGNGSSSVIEGILVREGIIKEGAA